MNAHRVVPPNHRLAGKRSIKPDFGSFAHAPFAAPQILVGLDRESNYLFYSGHHEHLGWKLHLVVRKELY